jgi:hypothetical protein
MGKEATATPEAPEISQTSGPREKRESRRIFSGGLGGHTEGRPSGPLIDFTDHLGPAPGGDGPELVLHHPERDSLRACLDILSALEWRKIRAKWMRMSVLGVAIRMIPK